MSKVIQKSFLQVTMLSAAMALAGCGGGSDGSIDSLQPQPSFDFPTNGGGGGGGGGGSPTSTILEISNLKLFASDGSETRKVTVAGATAKGQVVDENGKGIPNALVTFTGEGLIFGTSSSNGNGAVRTDADGVASISVKPSDSTTSGTYSLSASIEYQNETATSNTYYYDLISNDNGGPVTTEPVNIGFVDLGGVKEITSTGVKVHVMVIDDNGDAIPDAPVKFDGGGVTYSTTNGTVLTDSNGKAEIVLYPEKSDDSGTYGIKATVNFNGKSYTTVKTSYYTIVPGTVDVATDPVNIGNVTVVDKVISTEGTIAKVQVTEAAVNGKPGKGISGAKVTFSGGGVTYNRTNGTVMTDAEGWAKIKLYPADVSDSGTYGITATADFGSNSDVTEATSYYQLEGKGQPAATDPVNIGVIRLTETLIDKSGTTATVKVIDSNKVAIKNALVTFSGGGVNFSTSNGAVMTDSNGLASIMLSPADPKDTGTYGITATADFEGDIATSKSAYYTLKADDGNDVPIVDAVNIKEAVVLGKTLIDSDGTTATVVVLNKSKKPIKGALVTFSGGGVDYSKTNGTVLTGSDGKAVITITPTDPKDSGTYGITATAVYNGDSSKATNPSYYQLEAKNTSIIDPLNISPITLTDNGSDIANPAQTTIVTSAKATAHIVIKNKDDQPVRGALVTFETDGGVTFSSSNGSVLTDVDGKASIVLSPANITDTGAYTLSANATYEGDTTETVNYNFSLQALEIKLVDMELSEDNISSGASTNVTLVTKDGNDIAQNGIAVSFNTNCGTFSDDSVISSDSGNVTTTYTAIDANGKLCSGTKTITASTSSGKSVTAEVTIAEIKADSVVYTTKEPVVLGVKGSGSSNTAKIQFTLYSNGIPVANKPVRISKIATSPFDLEIDKIGNKAPFVVESNSEGVVTVNLYPGTKSGPVEILAEVMDAPDKESVTPTTGTLSKALSKNVSVAIGRVTQNGLSISMERNVLRVSLDGDSTMVMARAVDRWGNTVPEGTVVSFTAEGGKIGSNCATVDGYCDVKFNVQNPRPIDGRVSIVAYLEGDKTYDDTDNDNFYTLGVDTLLNNIGDWFRDDDEDNTLDSDERLYQKGGSGATCITSTFNSPNIKDTCSDDLTATIRKQAVIGLGNDSPTIVDLPPKVSLNGTSSATQTFYMFGRNDQAVPMPSGTTVSVTAVDKTKFTPAIIKNVDSAADTTTITVSQAMPDSVVIITLDGATYNRKVDASGSYTETFSGVIEGEAAVAPAQNNMTCSAEIVQGNLILPAMQPMNGGYTADGIAVTDTEGVPKILPSTVMYIVSLEDCAAGDYFNLVVKAPGALITKVRIGITN